MSNVKMFCDALPNIPWQEKPDGNFPTCPYLNPEIREAMQKGLELCDKVHPDLLLGTDPDCDRCGTAVPQRSQSGSVPSSRSGCTLSHSSRPFCMASRISGFR